jgi:hypothetical protein
MVRKEFNVFRYLRDQFSFFGIKTRIPILFFIVDSIETEKSAVFGVVIDDPRLSSTMTIMMGEGV